MENAATRFVRLETANERLARAEAAPARNEAMRRSRRLDPSNLRSVLEYGRPAQVRLNGLVGEVISRLDSGRALRERVRDDSRELNRIEPRLPRGTRGWERSPSLAWILDFEGRLANRHDRFQSRMNGLVPRLSDASARALDEIHQLDTLTQRNDELLEELDAWIVGARLHLNELQENAPEAVAHAPERWIGEALPRELREVVERLERLESRLENLEASRDLGRRQKESLHAMRRDLELLLGQLQTALFDLIPRWQERFRDAIVASRRAQTSRFARSLARSLDRDEVEREIAQSDASRHDSPETVVEDDSPRPIGPVALQAITPTAAKRERPPIFGTSGFWWN